MLRTSYYRDELRPIEIYQSPVDPLPNFEGRVAKTIEQFLDGDFQMWPHLGLIGNCFQSFLARYASESKIQSRLIEARENLFSLAHFTSSISLVKSIERRTINPPTNPKKNQAIFHKCLLDYGNLIGLLDKELENAKNGKVAEKIANELRGRAYDAIWDFEQDIFDYLPLPEVPSGNPKSIESVLQFQQQIKSAIDPWARSEDSSNPNSPSYGKYVSSLKVPYDQILNQLYLGNGIGLLAAAGCCLDSIFQPEFDGIESMLEQMRLEKSSINFDTIISITTISSILSGDWMDVEQFISQNQEESVFNKLRRKKIEWHCIGCVDDEPSSENWKSLVAACSLSLDDIKPFEELTIAEKFEPTFKRMDEAVFGNKKMFIHCQAGVSRSASLVAVYLINRFDVSPNQAIAFLRTRRYCVNPKFILWLDSYAQSLKTLRSKSE